MKTLVRNYDPSWELLRELAELADGTVNSETLYILTQQGELEVWGNGDYTVAVYVEDSVFNIFSLLGGGAIRELGELTQWLQERAKSLRCSKLQILGRAAWVRLLKKYGYKQTAVMLECEVT